VTFHDGGPTLVGPADGPIGNGIVPINVATVPEGNWLLVATVNGIGGLGVFDDEPHAWRVNCDLRDSSVPGPDGLGAFIGGNFITGFATNGLTDQHELTITAGTNVPAGTTKPVAIVCFADVEGHPGTWRTGGSRIVLLQIGGFF
jgi:hypothetical protein